MNFENEVLKIITENIEEGVHVIDREGRTIIYNKAMETLEGYDGKEVIGRKILELFPSLDEETSTLCKALKIKEVIPDKYQNYINKKGYNITTVNMTLPIKIDNEMVGAVEIAKDFTKIKELYERIIHLAGKEKHESSNLPRITFNDITGCSSIFLKAVDTARKAANSSSTVLIYGETGTGKEVISRCIHNESPRRNKPFIAVNCAALPEGLLEGILFGTVKGGFTGAINRPGLFEQANNGTLLLDEINSMSTGLQAKLLRVLQESHIRRVGGVKDIPVNARIIATTNEEPHKAIEEGKLRRDLYYRLSVVNIIIPTLKERKDDIPFFIKEFIKDYNKVFSKDVFDVSDEVYDAFMNYEWPGNVRELKNYIEGAMNMVSDHIIKKENFTSQVQETIFSKSEKTKSINLGKYVFGSSIDEYMEGIEKNIISNALNRCEGNITGAAKLLKIKRQTLQHKMKKYNIHE